VPAEWIAAHGLRPHRLIPTPIEGASTIPRIEGLCPYARAFANDAARAEVTGIVVTTACDQMRRIFDLLVRQVEVPVFLLNVPSTWQTVAAQRLYLDELKRLGRFLVRLGGREPGKEGLARIMLDATASGRHDENGVHSTPCASVHAHWMDSGWQRQTKSSELADGATGEHEPSTSRRLPLPPSAGRADTGWHRQAESSELGDGGLPVRGTIAKACGLDDATRNSFQVSQREEYAGVPIALVGGPLMQRDRVLFDIVNECGGRIVLDATETGQRSRHAPFDRRHVAEDPLLELAQAYFQIPEVSRRPNSELYRWLAAELPRAGARGIILHHYVWCDKWHAEFERMKEWSRLPMLRLDSEGQGEMDSARVRNRIQAFVETLR